MPTTTTTATRAANEPGLISKVISHAGDKLPLVRYPLSSWTSNSNNTRNETTTATNEDVVYYRLSPRGSYAATPPPPYEKVASPSSPSMLSKLLSASGLTQGSSNHPNSTNDAMTTTIDTKQVEHAVTLINIASEMDQSGNHQMAFDLYMMGLDRMLSAFPLETNANMKRALEDKIREFKQEKRLNLDLPPADVTELAEALNGTTTTTTTTHSATRLTELVVNALVYGAVTLKKSPVPYVLTSVMTYAKAGLQLVDDTCQIRRRTRDIASHGMAKAVELERHYEIHEKLTESMNAVYGAIAKANAAYTETPGFKQDEDAAVPAA